jgi:hypothetical protein
MWVGHGVEQFPIENRPEAILGFATRGRNLKTKNAITPLILVLRFFMVGTSSKGTSHILKARYHRSKFVRAAQVKSPSTWPKINTSATLIMTTGNHENVN